MNIIPAFVRNKVAKRPNFVKILNNIGWLFFDKILRMGVGLLVGVWIARYLGPDQFGMLNFATALIGLSGAVAGLGLQDIVVRDIVRYPVSARITLGTAAVLQLAGALLAYLLILATIAYLRPEDTLARTIIAILGATMLFKSSELATYWFESQVQSKYTVWVQNGVFLLFAVVKVGLILNHAPLVAFVWAALAEAGVVSLILMVVMNSHGPKLATLYASVDRAKTLLRDSWPLILSSLSVMVYMKMDQIMLGLMTNDATVGVYSAAVKITEVWYFVPVGIVASVFPTLLKAHAHSEELYNKHLQYLCDALVIIGLSISLPVAVFSEKIVTLLYGQAFYSSSSVLKVYILGMVFVCMAVVGNKWYVAINRQGLGLRRDLTGALTNVSLNYILIPNYGAVGAATSTVLSYSFAHFFLDYFSQSTRELFFMKLRAINVFCAVVRLKKGLFNEA